MVCPAVFEETGGGSLVIIGAITEPEAISGRVGPGEVAIEIDRGLVTRAIGGPVSRLLMKQAFRAAVAMCARAYHLR